MTRNLNTNTYKVLFFGLCLFTSGWINAQSPQVLRVSQIKEYSRVSETLQRNGDHFYTTVGKRSNENLDLTSDLVIDSFEFVPEIILESGNVLDSTATVILDYKVGEGFVDYDYISHTIRHYGHYKNDSLVAFGIGTNHCTWNGITYSPEIIPDSLIVSDLGFYIAVLNHQNDSLQFLVKTSVESRLFVDKLTLAGDFLYVVTRTNEDTFTFMGEFFPEVIDPNWNVKHIHKINWKTGEKVWSRQFSTDIDQDYLFDIKVVEDGSLIIAKRITGRTHWDGVPIEGNTVYDSGYAFFKISPDGELLDYIQSECDCKGFHRIHIEDDGSLMLYGAQKYMPNLTLGDATLELYSDTLYGLFGYVPPDWEHPWIKTYHGSYQNAVTGATIFNDDEIIAIIGYKEEINVEGFDFATSNAGVFTDPWDGFFENILVSYELDGTLKYRPISIPLNARIHEIHEISKNHYLFYVEEDFGDNSTIFDTQLAFYGDANFMIFEIEGELFDIVDNLDDLIQPYIHESKLYPNPAVAGEQVIVEIENIDFNKGDIYMISSSGQKITLDDYTRFDQSIKINLPSVSSGLYYLILPQKNKRNQYKLYIK